MFICNMEEEKLRLWEIDFARGFALVAMILYHLIYNINMLLIKLPIIKANWDLGSSLIGGAFLCISGCSLWIGVQRNRIKSFSDAFRSGGKVFLFGTAISVFSLFNILPGVIYFGILHSIGISIILGYFFLSFKSLNILLGSVLLVGGLYFFSAMQGGHNIWLIWSGFRPSRYAEMLDYYPLIPWFGPFLIGIGLGSLLYSSGDNRFSFPKLEKSLPFQVITRMGRHSLLIYLIHAPILFLTVYLVKLVVK